MSDEDERQPSSSASSHNEADNRRLSEIKTELHRLMRQKKRHDTEKLTQENEFLQSEIVNFRTAINDVNRQINAEIQRGKTLRYEMDSLRSKSGLRHPNLANALRDKRRYETELKKPDKTEGYRKLARDSILSIDAALPVLREEDNFKKRLQTAKDAQQEATDRRQKLEDGLNKAIRKQNEIKQLLNENAVIVPQIEANVKNLRTERERLMEIVSTTSSAGGKKTRRRSSGAQRISTDAQAAALPPNSLLVSLQQETLESEQRHHEEQLEKVRLLSKYFREQMAENNLSMGDTPCSTPSTELTSPLFNPVTPYEEQTILSSYMDDRDDNVHELSQTTTTNEQPAAIAMKLPRTFAPLDFNTPTTNQIIHSPYYDGVGMEYKKELASDIVDKYGGTVQTKKNRQYQRQIATSGKKNKKNKKGFAIKHSSQIIALYNDVCGSSGNSDTFPSIPMYEYELPNTIRELELLQQSLESYLFELSLRHYSFQPVMDEVESAAGNDEDEYRDSAVDTFSEASSLVEPMNTTKLLTPVIPLLSNIPEARSSSSSDDKKTIASSPPSSHHSDSKGTTAPPPLSNDTLATVDELPSTPLILPLSIQMAQIDRQISDEGYRSVRNEQQQTQTTIVNNRSSPLLVRSKSYNCTEKVDKWLSSTTPPACMSSSAPSNNEHDDNNNINLNEFQAMDIDDDDDDDGENSNSAEAAISVANR